MEKRFFKIITLIVLVLIAVFLLTNKTAKNEQKLRLLKNQSFAPAPTTIQRVFANDHSWTATLSANHIRILTATGDIIPARSVNANMVRSNNALWPFEGVIDKLKSLRTDITFINLETPLFSECQPTVEGMNFCGSDRNIEGLKAINVTVANLANNHAGNYGLEKIAQTEKLLLENGVTPVGTSGAVFKNVRGETFAFLGYNDIGAPEPGISWADEEKIHQEVSNAKKQADIVIVTFHFGTEYQPQPDKKQIELAHLAIDSGADVVIGNHPHWIQPVELYKNKFITYAHGNFVFDQMWSQKTREGVVGRYIFYDKTLIDVEFLPVQIENYGQPHFVVGKQKEEILSGMFGESKKLNRL